MVAENVGLKIHMCRVADITLFVLVTLVTQSFPKERLCSRRAKQKTNNPAALSGEMIFLL